MNKFKFFYNKKSNHYAVIYNEDKNNYFYLTLTHSLRYRNNNNLKLLKNPNLKDEKNAYIIPKIYKLNKSYFKDTANHLVLSEEDKNQIIDMVLEKETFKKMQNFEFKLKEVYELQNKFSDNSEWLANQKTIIVTDDQLKIYDENASIRNKIEETFQDSDFIKELNNQVKNNYAKLEQLALSSNKNNNNNYLCVNFNEYDEIIMPNLASVKLNNDLLSLLKKQDFLINILHTPNRLEILEPDNLVDSKLNYYKTFISSNDSKEKEYDYFRLDIGDGPKYNLKYFTKLEQKIIEFDNKEKKIMNKKETEIKEEKKENTMANEKDTKENVFFQIDPSQILESSESDKKNHLMKIIFPQGSKYEGYIAVLPDYCNRGFNKFKADKIDIMLTPKTKPFIYINNVKATEIAKLLDSDHDFNKRVFNLTDNQCVVKPNQVLHKTDKSYIIGFPEGSKYENAVKAIVPIKNVQEFKGDGKLKLTISNNQVLQAKNTLSNEFLAKALRDREKTNEKALDNKKTTKEQVKKELVKEIERER